MADVKVATLLKTVLDSDDAVIPPSAGVQLLAKAVENLAQQLDTAQAVASHVVRYGARYTTVGGAAAEAITVTGLAATDLVFVRLVSGGTSSRTISSWAATLNTLTVTFSGNPGNDAIIEYIALRAPSAGVYETTVEAVSL